MPKTSNLPIKVCGAILWIFAITGIVSAFGLLAYLMTLWAMAG